MSEQPAPQNPQVASQPVPGVRRFRVNPVELAVFGVVSLIFFNSIYNLFYDQQGFHPAALTPMAAVPTSEGRLPASVSQTFINLETRCDVTPDKDTNATKVRITGPICGEGRLPASDSSQLVKTQVINGANRFAATVFADTTASKFSTDYIPLNLGKNPIHVEFSYRGGKTVTQDFNVVKN